MFFLDNFLKGLKPQFDDDIVDRLNYYYTPMLLVIFSLTLSAKQYVGQPIQCWVPAQFTGAWEQYSENYCFVQNTYFLPLQHYIPRDFGEREDREIGYYQWVPFVLALQAVLFYMPCLIWRLLNWQSGITVKGVVNMAQDVQNMQIDKRKESVSVVAAHIHDALDSQRKLSSSSRFLGMLLYGKHYGSYVTGLYLFVKFLYFIQVICQFLILNSFLGTNYTFWGFEILRDLAYGREWEESGHFPRVTMCDFEVRVLGNLHRHTVQCVLMVNMFNEKIYLFLWWWFLLVAVCTLLSLIYWIVMSIMKGQQRVFIHRYLRVYDLVKDDMGDRRALSRFVNNCLRPDGVFLLRMVATNAGDLITTDIVSSLWKQFLNDQAAERPPPPSLSGSAPPKGLDDVDFHENPYASEKKPLASVDSSPR